MNAEEHFIEVQGTGEEATFSNEQLNQMLSLGKLGIKQLLDLQQTAIKQGIKLP